AAALAYYRGLGFGAREWHGGGYGFVTFDGVEIHLGAEPDLEKRPDRRSTAYLFVEDADALAQVWVAAGGDVRLPQDTEWRQDESRSGEGEPERRGDAPRRGDQPAQGRPDHDAADHAGEVDTADAALELSGHSPLPHACRCGSPDKGVRTEDHEHDQREPGP